MTEGRIKKRIPLIILLLSPILATLACSKEDGPEENRNLAQVAEAGAPKLATDAFALASTISLTDTTLTSSSFPPSAWTPSLASSTSSPPSDSLPTYSSPISGLTVYNCTQTSTNQTTCSVRSCPSGLSGCSSGITKLVVTTGTQTDTSIVTSMQLDGITGTSYKWIENRDKKSSSLSRVRWATTIQSLASPL